MATLLDPDTLASTAASHPTSHHRRLALGPLSLRLDLRVAGVVVALAVVAVALLAVSLLLGDFPLAAREVWASLVGAGSPEADFVVRTLRLPRALTAALVGMAFGLSGALLQRITDNVLASPDLIGITAGASAGAVSVIVLVGSAGASVTTGALGGGLAAATAMYVLSWRRGVTGTRLVLVGIGLNAALTAVTHYLLSRADITDAQRAVVWLTGSLNGRSWDHVVPMAIALAVLAPLALSQGRGLRTLQLGDDAARGLGLRVQGVRSLLVIASVLLAATATAAAGPIAFVALASPSLAHRMCGGRGVALVPAMGAGAVMVLAADQVAQHLMGGLPVGVATALVGAPYLLYLLSRAGRIGSA